jgi:hypothetical protein
VASVQASSGKQNPNREEEREKEQKKGNGLGCHIRGVNPFEVLGKPLEQKVYHTPIQEQKEKEKKIIPHQLSHKHEKHLPHHHIVLKEEK